MTISKTQIDLKDQTPSDDLHTERDRVPEIRSRLQHWKNATEALRNPDCCIVSVCSPSHGSTGCLDNGLRALQHELANNGPPDIDIRTRINTTTIQSTYGDCSKIWHSIFGDDKIKNNVNTISVDHSISVLTELALGMSSFQKPQSNIYPTRPSSDRGVYMRIVCASSYDAHDPVYHTDKCPLRGYVTLRGVGTEFVTHPCSPFEYMGLRSFGSIPRNESVRSAQELEFIVMKGDYYYDSELTSPGNRAQGWWQRAFACVHRSPPGGGSSGRRVIVSFDLADGDDNREWYDVGQKRNWRSGMTQRKSRLVA